MRFAGDLSEGYLDPSQVQRTWHLHDSPHDGVAVLRRALDKDGSPGGVGPTLDALPTRHPGYASLRDAFVWYRQLRAAGGWPTLPDTATLAPGDTAAVAALVDRLDITNDLPAGTPNGAAPTVYDAAIAEGVRHFQARHGLDTSGVVDADTRRALNVSARQRTRTLALNLERHRWLPEDRRRGGNNGALVVNVSGFRLFGYRNNRRAFSMPVIVGEQGWQTPVFADTLTHVVFHPYWNVPRSIALEDLLPQIRADSSFLQRKGYEVVGPGGRVLPPDSLRRSAIKKQTMRLRQRPDASNALGRVKFLFPNDFNVYLHDTPANHLFRRSDRAFSHGCIRVAQPVQVADFVLGRAWPKERIREAMQPDASRRYVRVQTPVPVYVLYLTAWPTMAGDVQFRDDPYAYDAPLRSALHPVASTPPDACAALDLSRLDGTAASDGVQQTLERFVARLF